MPCAIVHGVHENLCWEVMTGDTNFRWEKQEQHCASTPGSDDGMIRREPSCVFCPECPAVIHVFELSASIFVPHMARSKNRTQVGETSSERSEDNRFASDEWRQDPVTAVALQY